MEGDTRKITITEGLRELKLYDAKISKAIATGNFIKAGSKAADNINGVSKATLENNIRADFQSVCDLIENRSLIKQKIAQSNALTKISVNGVEYTVAEAIEKKNSIAYEKRFLDRLKEAYVSNFNAMTTHNNMVEKQIDTMIMAFVSKDSDKKLSPDDLKALSEPYRHDNEWGLLDPLDICEKIKLLEGQIDGFESAVDTQLSISNSITFIEV